MADVDLSTLGSVIKTAYEGEADTNAFTDALLTKVNNIEAAADITDAANVAAAGAFMTATDTSDDITEGATNLFFTSAEKTKLDNIATAATANSSDAILLDRANHTGAQAISTVTGLQTALDGKLSTTGEAETVATINGRISQGTNVTISGTGTSASPYVISASVPSVSDGDKGDITVSSSGSVWTIDNGAVTFAKMQDIATNRILGRSTSGTGDIEALTLPNVRTLLNVEDGADVTDTANVTAAGAFMTASNTTDDITEGTTKLFNKVPSGGTTGQILAKSSNTDYALEWVEDNSGSVADGDKGDITVSNSGATWTIDATAVTLTKIQDIATSSLLGRVTASEGVVEVLTATQARTLLNVEDGATANPNAVNSDPTGVTGADAVTNIMSLTQAEYDEITPNASTIYFITDAESWLLN